MRAPSVGNVLESSDLGDNPIVDDLGTIAGGTIG
jgi:hypothetical protein